MICEMLERRCLLSASLQGGVLVIGGTYLNDVIRIGVAGGQVTVIDNGVVSNYSSSLVKSITVKLRGSNDDFSAISIPIPLWIIGGRGNDTLVGGNRPDVIEGGEGNDSIVGGNRHDTIYSGTGNDTLRGGGGNDLFITAGTTSVYGGRDNDTLRGGGGDDLFYGQLGSDTADYSHYSVGVSVRLDTVANDGAEGEKDNIALDVERIIGTSQDDYLSGGRDGISIEAGDGDDTLTAGLADALLDGGRGNDTLGGGGGDDTLLGDEGDDHLDGGPGADYFYGSDGIDVLSYARRSENLVLRVNESAQSGAEGENDSIGLDIEEIRGGRGNDLFVGSDNPETFYGLDGNDTLDGGWGNDTLWGGSGIDTADYSSRTTLQQLRIEEGSGIPGEQDIPHADIEVLIGGSGNDWIQGGSANNLLVGNGGNDTLIGMGGDDTLIGGDGADLLGYDATGGPSSADGDGGNDVIYTFDTSGNSDGDIDRISDVVGANSLHYSLSDPDMLPLLV